MEHRPWVHAVRLPMAAILGAAAVLPATIAAPVALEEQVLYPAGQMPAGVVVADLDGDTFCDIVVTNIVSEDVSVLRNLGDGTFAGQVRFPVGEQPRSIAVADLNGDGSPDLAVGLQSGVDALAVFLNDGAGGLTGPLTLGAGGSVPFTTRIARLDADAHPDVAMVRTLSGRGEVAVFFNRGNGTFSAEETYAIDPDAFTAGMGAEDIDADGDIDLVVSFAYHHQSPAVLLNAGNGSFELTEPFNTDITVTPGLAVGDLDGDEVPDVAAISGGIRIYVSDGEGGFAAPLIHDPEVLLSSASRLVLADMNRDGRQDLVVPGGLSDQVGILLNDGSGGLVDESLHPTGDYAVDAAVGDLDGDGWPDVVVANRDGQSVSVLRNAGQAASPKGAGPGSGVRLDARRSAERPIR